MDSKDLARMTGIFGSLPEAFPIDTCAPKALKDGQLSSLTYWCMGDRGTIHWDQKNFNFAAFIPPHAQKAREQYERVRDHLFFDRFIYFSREKEEDGMIVAIGEDEFYYVLATWDETKECVWVPEFMRDQQHLTPQSLGHVAA